jgi:hypothetical protein
MASINSRVANKISSAWSWAAVVAPRTPRKLIAPPEKERKIKKHDAAGIVFGVKERSLVRLNYIAGSLWLWVP